MPELWDEKKPARSITVSVYALVDASSVTEQISMFETSSLHEERTAKRETIIDSIREKFGDDSIVPLSSFLDDTGLGKK